MHWPLLSAYLPFAHAAQTDAPALAAWKPGWHFEHGVAGSDENEPLLQGCSASKPSAQYAPFEQVVQGTLPVLDLNFPAGHFGHSQSSFSVQPRPFGSRPFPQGLQLLQLVWPATARIARGVVSRARGWR